LLPPFLLWIMSPFDLQPSGHQRRAYLYLFISSFPHSRAW
jgi:hypothetical protein